jgi:hypothetical protein
VYFFEVVYNVAQIPKMSHSCIAQQGSGLDAPQGTPLPPALCARLGVPVGTLWGPPAHATFTHEGQTYPFKDVQAIFESFK